MQGFLDPAILFFVFGMLAGTLKSNLEIPPQISRFLSLYLLMALGLKGGFALAESGLTAEISVSLGVGIALAVIVPALGYGLLRRFLNGYDAAAIAATYGSVSAVTFITAVQYLDQRTLPYGGHMAAAMALMESPAIIMAVLLANWVRQHDKAPGQSMPLGKVLHESLTDGAQLLLLGAMVVGILTTVVLISIAVICCCYANPSCWYYQSYRVQTGVVYTHQQPAVVMGPPPPYQGNYGGTAVY